jgi:hypothetical protein
VDSKRGQVFLVQGTQVNDMSAFGSGMNRFFVEHLPFMIDNNFPDVNIDNHFKGIGLHGVYDSVYDRVIITKLDYAPKSNNILYDPVEQSFYINNVVNGFTIRQDISLSDEQYFCNVSWTLSFNMNTKSWISFHSYLPNFYIAENNFFYSGQNNCCEDFDFLVGVLIPNPTTTTTSSTSTSSTSTTSTTSTSTSSTTTTTTTGLTTTTTSTCPTYYELEACDLSEVAFTLFVPDLGIGQQYVLPGSPVKYYTYTGSSTTTCIVPGTYNASIQKTLNIGCPPS